MTRGIMAFQAGDRNTSYRMMRYRVLFQGGVAFMVLFGVLFRPERPDPSLKTHYTLDKATFLRAAKEVRVSSEEAAERANKMGGAALALKAEYDADVQRLTEELKGQYTRRA